MWVLLSARSLSSSARRGCLCACLPFAVWVVHFFRLGCSPAWNQRRPASVQLHPGTIPPAVPFTNPVSGPLVFWVVVVNLDPPAPFGLPLHRIETRPGLTAPRAVWTWNPPRELNPGKAPARVNRGPYLTGSPAAWYSTTGAPTVFVKLSRAARTIPRAALAVNFLRVHTCPVTVPDSPRTAARVNSSPAAV